MNVDLPPRLKLALEASILEEYAISALKQAAESVSLRYRQTDRNGTDVQIKSKVEALSYLAARMPATFAANIMVMTEVEKKLVDFLPRTLLDIGAGPGTSSVAASYLFKTLEQIEMVEPNNYLQSAGRDVLEPFLPKPVWIASSIENFKPRQLYDIIVASYVLNEISEEKWKPIIQKFWDSCSGVMMILEPGTPQGAKIIQSIRNWAVEKQVHILAPCPHSHTCPLSALSDSESGAWCHFAVRTARSKLHKILKGGEAGFEDEKFSYIILSRILSETEPYRLIGHPSGSKLREMQVCGPKGAETLQVSKSHPLHKKSKKLEWGDSFDVGY